VSPFETMVVDSIAHGLALSEGNFFNSRVANDPDQLKLASDDIVANLMTYDFGVIRARPMAEVYLGWVK